MPSINSFLNSGGGSSSRRDSEYGFNPATISLGDVDPALKVVENQKSIQKTIEKINSLLQELVKEILKKKNHTTAQQADLIHKFYQHLLWFKEYGYK